jgi:hypothetical protein
MHRAESDFMRSARQADLDWDVTTSILVLIGTLTCVYYVASGFVWLLDTLAAMVGA